MRKQPNMELEESTANSGTRANKVCYGFVAILLGKMFSITSPGNEVALL
jgi:hypothetical protein